MSWVKQEPQALTGATGTRVGFSKEGKELRDVIEHSVTSQGWHRLHICLQSSK